MELVQVLKNVYVSQADLQSGSKLLVAYNANGSFKLKRGRMCFYDTKWKTLN